MSGLIGKKVGMTSVYDELGQNTAVTVLEVEPCVITQIKTIENDGYSAVQMAALDKKEKNTTKALKGHFDKAGASPKKYVREFRGPVPEGFELGNELKIEDLFEAGDMVDIIGTTKGKGFTGVMKRHNFRGVGDATHGQYDQQRMPGAIGNASDPSRVFKGKKMAGRSGNSQATVKDLTVAKVLPESKMMLVTGSVPGPKGGIVEIHKIETTL